MQTSKKLIAVFSLILVASAFLAFMPKNATNNNVPKANLKPVESKIQVAILLDVSGSMDGLIAQAKAQLWSMVNLLGKSKNNQQIPNIEIALYEYGRSSNDPKKGYVKQINSFLSNLDSLSENLFSLTTNGGDEYCGQAIYTAIDELKWEAGNQNYKVIFIAGNEDFLQGNIKYTEACQKANEKGVIVNTIYCGPKQQGIAEHWNLGGECGQGSFSNINTNASIEDIPTPYDSAIYALNGRMNKTYMNYGYIGASGNAKQSKMDAANATMSKKAGIQRIAAKGNKSVYNNAQWDLVDAIEKDEKALDKIDINTLADSLKTKTKEQIKAIVMQQGQQRSATQKEVSELIVKREAFLAEAKKNNAKPNEQNLETEMEKIIKVQATKFGYVFE
jgi:hypothetical protein